MRGAATRSRKWKQSNTGVLKEYIAKVDERMHMFINSTALLMEALEKEYADIHEVHLMDWCNFSEELKEQGRDVVTLLNVSQQMNQDR